MRDGRNSWCSSCKNKDRLRYARWGGYKEANLAYYYNNKDKWRIIKANRRARELNAIPKWFDELEELLCKEIYQHCIDISKYLNVPHEVDHIIPLGNKQVCGLHYSKNLQIITRTENRKKSNKLTEERYEHL